MEPGTGPLIDKSGSGRINHTEFANLKVVDIRGHHLIELFICGGCRNTHLKRLCYNQREGIDYEETFSPVAKIVTIRIILTLDVHNNWNLYQFDINNAFLYGELEEDVYMTLRQRYHDRGDKRVCKLLKSLYGLKQAPRKWNEKLCSSLFSFGFKQSINDYSMFVMEVNNKIVVLLVYVDDIILTGNDDVEISKVKEFLKSQFLIKDLGLLKYFLGIEVIEIPGGLCLNQRKLFGVVA
ncbi:hypothetical protein LXL04_021171 [Taraxacum kok-saghyz]